MAPASKKSGKSKASKAASGVIEIDLNDVEVRETYDGEDPRPGFYTFELVNVRAHTSQAGNEGIAWVFALRDNALYEGWVRTVHSNMLPKGVEGSSLWKTGEILVALAGGVGVKGTKGAQVRLDLNSEKAVANFLKKAKMVRGRVQRRRDSDDDDPQFEIGKIIAIDEAKLAARAAAEAALEDDDDDAEDDDEDGFEDAEEYDEDDDADEDESDEEDDDEDSDEEDDEDSDDDDDEDDEGEDEDDDDEDEEPEPEPAPKKKAKPAATKKAAAPAKKASSKVTNIADAKSKKKRK